MENENIKLSAGEKLAITSRTPDKMPLNPTAQGWTGSAIRAELGKAILLLVDLLEGKLEGVYETFSVIGNVTVVDDLDDTTRETGVYIEGNDIVFHSGDSEEPVQIGIIGGIFVYRVYQDAEWKVSEGIYEAANPNIQEHIAIVDGNPHGVDKTDVGLGNVGNFGIASPEEAVAEAGEVNNKYMTPLRTKEAIDAKASGYYTQEQVDAIISGVYKPSGSLSPAEIVNGLLIETNLGNVYNITGEFTSTADFKDGGGKVYAAGTNLAIVLVGETYMFDVLMGYDIDAANVIYNDSNVKDEIANLKTTKADLSDCVEKEVDKELIPTVDLEKLQAIDLTVYVEKEVGKELIPTADLQKLQAIDSLAETIETSVTIETTDWVADGVTATYKAVKTVNGVLSSDNPIISFDLTGIADTAWTASRTEFAKIGLASTTDDDEITFYASATPSEDITVIVKVVR